MNNAMLQTALAVLADPKFVEELSAKILAEREKRAAFGRSEVFNRMVEALTSQTESVAVDNEEASYFPDRVRATADWAFATDDDIKMFFTVMSDAQADTVTPDSQTKDEDNPFDNCSFQHHGLLVSVMSGQGTFIRISNDK